MNTFFTLLISSLSTGQCLMDTELNWFVSMQWENLIILNLFLLTKDPVVRVHSGPIDLWQLILENVFMETVSTSRLMLPVHSTKIIFSISAYSLVILQKFLILVYWLDVIIAIGYPATPVPISPSNSFVVGLLVSTIILAIVCALAIAAFIFVFVRYRQQRLPLFKI